MRKEEWEFGAARYVKNRLVRMYELIMNAGDIRHEGIWNILHGVSKAAKYLTEQEMTEIGVASDSNTSEESDVYVLWNDGTIDALAARYAFILDE